MLNHILANHSQGNTHRLLLRIFHVATGQKRKSNGLAALFLCQLQGRQVSTAQQRFLAAAAIHIQRPHCMNNIPARQAEALRCHGTARLAGADGMTSLFQLFCPCPLEDGIAGAIAMLQPPVGRIDNSISLNSGNIISHNNHWHNKHLAYISIICRLYLQFIVFNSCSLETSSMPAVSWQAAHLLFQGLL